MLLAIIDKERIKKKLFSCMYVSILFLLLCVKQNNKKMIFMKRNSVHFFVTIITLSFFILCLFFLEWEIGKGRLMVTKKMFHHLFLNFLNQFKLK